MVSFLVIVENYVFSCVGWQEDQDGLQGVGQRKRVKLSSSTKGTANVLKEWFSKSTNFFV